MLILAAAAQVCVGNGRFHLSGEEIDDADSPVIVLESSSSGPWQASGEGISMLRQTQHARTITNDFMLSFVRPEQVEG